MGQKEKLIAKLLRSPKSFTFDDAETLLGFFAYRRNNKGGTSGSRTMFESPDHAPILLHRPHPQKELKAYQTKQLIEHLKQEGLL